MKTLRVTLEDILGPVGPGHGQTSTEVWVRYVDATGPAHLVTTDGTVVTNAARRVQLDAAGVADIEVYASDDAAIDPDFRGFGVQVGWDFKARGVHGQTVPARGSGTVQVLTASPEVSGAVMFGSLDPFVPLTAIGGGGTVGTEEVQDIVGAMVAAAGGTYNDDAGTITLPSGGSGAPSGTAGGDLAGTYPNPTVVPASTTVAGKVELATNAEATTGTDTARAVTPAGARAAGDARYMEVHTFTITGSAYTTVGTHRLYVEGAHIVDTVRASVGTAPTGASLIVDVNRNGTTIYGTQANRPTIAAAANSGAGGLASNGTLAPGDYLTVDVDQVGSTVPGSNLTVTVRLRKA